MGRTLRQQKPWHPDFGHPPATIHFWRSLAHRALRAGAATPTYLFSAEPVRQALAELAPLASWLAPLGVRHWFSCKTQPLPALLRWWRKRGRPIEVVSEMEFRLAREAGFGVDDLLVNGPAKQRWLPQVSMPGLLVNFDSRNELAALLPLAKRQPWRTGLRVLTNEEFDPETLECGGKRSATPLWEAASRRERGVVASLGHRTPNSARPTQFGFEADSVPDAVRRLRHAGLEPEVVHFHLRTNVASAASYARAIRQVAEICHAADWQPCCLDIGGGLPPPWTLSRERRRFDVRMKLPDLAAAIRREAQGFPGLREVWLENGRFLTARSGALLITVLDVKERRGLRQLICDGGRTLHALVSNWEEHELIPLSPRNGPRTLTAVYGPTCMAFDQLCCRPMPRSIRPGDRLLWLDAGAYHLSWETRFSHPLAEIWWHEERAVRCVRRAEPMGIT